MISRVQKAGRQEDNFNYYTSGEDTRILLDESHLSKLLATCVNLSYISYKEPFSPTKQAALRK